MAKKSIKDVNLSGKKVLARVDYNVPLEEQDGKMVITDDKRVVATLPTLRYLIEQGAAVILCSHMGRPKGERVEKYSLKPVAEKLAELLGSEVQFADDCIGDDVKAKAAALEGGQVLLLENVRYHAAEEKNDPEFAKELASIADAYVNDAFGSAHRAHASTAGVTEHIETCVGGLLMEAELKFLGGALEDPKRPFVVILGGAKVSDKIKVIDRVIELADTVMIGGAMAYTFALAQGRKIGDSLAEPDKVELAQAAIDKAKEKGVKLLLPVDTLITDSLDFGGKSLGDSKFIEPNGDIPDGWEGVDIGPETTKTYTEEISKASMVVWNGPMGIFEIPSCAKGTFAVAEALVENSDCVSIIGGGDSAKAIKKAGLADKVTFISTGGGASLEFLEGKALPGIEALNDA